MLRNKETNLVNRIRTYQRLDKANKQCANCGEMGPVYICTDFHTFVCTECSGLHREFSHKVKSISMSNWTLDEVVALEASGGNSHDHALYMASHNPRNYPLPSSVNREKLRDFIRAKYIERRWMAKPGESHSRISAPALPTERSIKSPPLKVSEDLLSPASSVKATEKVRPTKEVGWAEDLVTVVPVEGNNLLEQSSKTHNLPTVEKVESHFHRSVDLLLAVKKDHPEEAAVLARSVIEQLQKEFNVKPICSPNQTVPPPIYSPQTISSMPPCYKGMPCYPQPIQTPSSNPFDFLPTPISIGLPVPGSNQSPLKPSVGMSSPVVPPPSSNPFDFFQ